MITVKLFQDEEAVSSRWSYFSLATAFLPTSILNCKLYISIPFFMYFSGQQAYHWHREFEKIISHLFRSRFFVCELVNCFRLVCKQKIFANTYSIIHYSEVCNDQFLNFFKSNLSFNRFKFSHLKLFRFKPNPYNVM